MNGRRSSNQLLVIGEVFEGLLEVSIRMLVPDFPGAGLLGARLHMSYSDGAPGVTSSKDFFFQAPMADPIRWAVPKKAGGGKEYSIHRHLDQH